MRLAAAFLFAIGLVAAQAAHGGLLAPFLAYPAYALVGMGMLCALAEAMSHGRRPWAMPLLAGTAVAGYALWRCSNGPDPALAWTDAALILGCAGMWIGVSLALTRNDARYVFFTICLAAACAQAVVAVLQLIRPGEFVEPYWLSEQLRGLYAARFAFRPRGLFMNPNQFAWLMNAMALMALSLGIWGRMGIIRRIGLLYLAGAFGVMTVLSASRGGMVSLAAGFGVFLLLSLTAVFASVTQRRLLLLVVGTVLLAACVGATYMAFSTSWIAQSRLDSLMSFDVREVLAEEAQRLFQMNPLLGAGPGVYRYAARMLRTGGIRGDPIFAHNDWLQFPAEYGFIGLSLMIILMVVALVCGTRGFLNLVKVASVETGSPLSSSAAFVLGATCALSAEAVHGNVDFNMHVPANALLAAALLGLVTGARPATLDSTRPRFPDITWFAVLGGLAVACGLGFLMTTRGPAEYHALRAENLLARNEVKRAIEETDKGLHKSPNDIALMTLRAKGLYEYESWLQMVTPAEVDSQPQESEEPEAGQEDDGNFKHSGADDAESTDDTNEDDDEVFNEMPSVLLTPEERKGFYEESAALYERLVRLQPLSREQHVGWGRALAALELAGQAREQFKQAIRLDPWHAYAWASYGDFLLDIEDVRLARRIYEVGANLPSWEYSRSQVESIDEDAQFDKELEEGDGK